MIHRVNFLQKGKYALTYQNMAFFMGAWVGFCLVIYGALWLQGSWAKARIMASKEAVKMLTVEFEKQAQLASATKTTERTDTAIQSLVSVFQTPPRWSAALAQIADAVPVQISLTVIKSSSTGSASRLVDVEGRGQSAEAIAQFAQRLDDAPLFQNVVMSRSTKDTEGGGGLLFGITAEAVFLGK